MCMYYIGSSYVVLCTTHATILYSTKRWRWKTLENLTKDYIGDDLASFTNKDTLLVDE